MLKKILSIFFIFCLVFSLTVSCFALPVDEDFVNPDPDFYSNKVILWCLYPNRSISINNLFYTWGSIRYLNTSTLSIVSGGPYPTGSDPVYIYVNGDLVSSSSLIDPITLTVDFGDSVFISLYPVNVYRICNYSSQTLAFYWNYSSVVSNRRSFYIEPNRYLYFGYIDSYSPCYIDRRDLFFNDIYYTSSEPYLVPHADLNIYDPDHVGDQTIDLYKNLFHSFDYFPDLVNQYRPVFIYITAILSILIVIFVVVFMIKRFSGGKT